MLNLRSPSRRSASQAPRRLALLALFLPPAVFFACTGDDDVFRPGLDAGAEATTSFDAATSPPDEAGGGGLSCGDGGVGPARALVTYGGASGGELVVVNLGARAVDGRLGFDGGYGYTSGSGTEPWLLAGESDVVTRLDPREPWKPVASWDVRGNDRPDGGPVNANPVAVVQVSCTKAYVLRFNRDRIAIIDPSQAAGGAPTRYVDLSSLREPNDPNAIEITSAVYVPSKGRVYVLLGNADLTQTIDQGFKIRCTDLRPSIVAIDVATDAVVSLGGTARGGGIALEGYNPPLGTPLVHDAVGDRLLVLQAGCNVPHDDGGAGDIVRRRVEQVALATGAVTTLLPLDTSPFPSTLAYASGESAALAFYFAGYAWDPRQATLGAEIAGGLDLVARDGRGGFIGTRSTYFEDGGAGPVQVVAITAPDAGSDAGLQSSVVVEGPFTKPGGFVGGIEAWQ